MKKLVFVAIVMASTLTFAQEETPSNWKKKGNVSFLFNQSAFNNEWLGGGVSNIAGTLGFTYEFNYAKGDWTWDNRLSASYGVTKVGDANTAKSDDRLEFNSIAGKKAGEKWYYSGIFNFRSQMDRGVDGNGIKNSHFLSPVFIQSGLGMLYKPSETFKLNIAPVAGKLIYVDEQFTVAGPSFGVLQGDTIRTELGASVNVYSKYEVLKNVTFENLLNLYSNYFEDAQNVDINYTLNIAMKINKYMSTNISFQAIYDDNAIAGAQIREVFGLGVNYGF